MKGENVIYKRHIIGKIGEEIVTKYLLENNYRIIERNFQCRQGEIDIIAKDKNEIVFIEVKTRTNYLYGLPSEAVDSIKQNHIKKVINYYLYKNKLEDCFVRIDVIEAIEKEEKFYINHIKKAIY